MSGPPPLRAAPITSGREGLRLLRSELNRGILRALYEQGAMTRGALVGWLLIPRSTVGERLEQLREAGLLESGGRGKARRYSLRPSGRALCGVIADVEHWLECHPKRSLESTSPVGWRAFAELADTWEGGLLEWIVRCAPGLEEVRQGFAGLGERALREELDKLTVAGLLERRRNREGAERYRLSDWGRRTIGVLASIARWEREFLPDASVPLALEDGIFGLLGILPLVRLEQNRSGCCSLALEEDAGEGQAKRTAVVWARVRRGRVVAVGEGSPPEAARGWAAGILDAWLDAVRSGRPGALRFAALDQRLQGLRRRPAHRGRAPVAGAADDRRPLHALALGADRSRPAGGHADRARSQAAL